jgi:hypothetical protein
MHDGTPTPGASACAPYLYQSATDEENASLPESGGILPCGQIAHSFFNDTYALSLDGQRLAIDDTNIAWSADRDHLYGDVMPINYNTDPALRGGNTTTVPLNQNEHWMVWLRPGGKNIVQKLYGQIDTAIPEGSSVTLTVSNKYNTYQYGGAKRVILTTNSWVGGRNLVLPIIYLIMSALCYLGALFFFVGYDLGYIWKRHPGTEDDFSWVRQSLSDADTPSVSQLRGMTPTSAVAPVPTLSG